MPTNAIGPTGLTIQTQPEIVAEILNGTPSVPGLYSIYGSDINVDPNSPDGQMVAIVAQAKIDVLEMLQQIFNSFDPDKAVGVTLNSRCGINGIKRRAGTQTVQSVTIVVDRALTLKGLDLYPLAPFTVADATGNQYQLLATQTPGGAATIVTNFQAKLIGGVQSAANTITTQVTVQLGVVSVNNPTLYTTLGLTEETDAALRIHRQLCVALPNKGYMDGLLAALVDTPGVVEAIILENQTGTLDSNSIPGHSIWAIVNGGTNAAVAQAIYLKRTGGCGMKGTVTINVANPDGSLMPIQFDRLTAENLWISFNVVAITGTVDSTYIRQQILALLAYKIGQDADTTTITALIKSISANASVSAQGVSNDGTTYVTLLATTGVNYQWALLSSRIIINGVAGP